MYVITIDGPASSGKGTIARIIAKKLGYNYLESGAIYRVLSLFVLNNNVKYDDVNSILNLIDKMNLQFLDEKVILNNEDVTESIRAEKVGMVASIISKHPEIRNKLLDFQRSFLKEPGLVTDGRDMGSIVFKDATLKVFLTASPEIRADRRYRQLQNFDKSVTIQAILRDIVLRDQQDSERKVAPLVYDETFKVLDNSSLSVEGTVSQILNWFFEKTGVMV